MEQTTKTTGSGNTTTTTTTSKEKEVSFKGVIKYIRVYDVFKEK